VAAALMDFFPGLRWIPGPTLVDVVVVVEEVRIEPMLHLRVGHP
jgi:hypothetical protein